MYLYIRHAEKLFDNGKKIVPTDCNHDPRITDEGRRKAKELGHELLSRYGRPNRILLSPYLRCRETAAMLMEAIDYPERPEDDVSMVVVPELGEYLGNQYRKGVEIELTEVTQSFDPPVDHNIEDLHRRVSEAHRRFHQDYSYQGVTWVVTHGIVIQTMKTLMGVRDIKGAVGCLSITEMSSR